MSHNDVAARDLGADAVAAFDRDGVICIRNLIEPQWIDRLRDAVEGAIARPGPGAKPGAPGFFVENSLWRRGDGFADFAFHGPVARAAAALMRSRQVRMFNDTMFVKEPASPEPTPWHHDLPYFKLGGQQNCSVWIPLDPASQASGAMTFVRGSHRWGKMFQPVGFGQQGGNKLTDESFDGAAPDVDADPDRYDTIGFDMQPGDVTFHHLLTLHKAGANTTRSTRRRVHTIRMAGDDATYLERPFATTEFKTTLRSGDKLDGSVFPVLWPTASATEAHEEGKVAAPA